MTAVFGQQPRFVNSVSANNLSTTRNGNNTMLNSIRASNNVPRSLSAGNYDAQQYNGRQIEQQQQTPFANQQVNNASYRTPAQQSSGGWRARAEQQEQYAQAIAQQQQLLQYEMLKLQAYQQAQFQQQYLAQAQMAMLALNQNPQQNSVPAAVSRNGSVNPQVVTQAQSYPNSGLGLTGGMSVKLREQRQITQSRALQSIRQHQGSPLLNNGLHSSSQVDGPAGLSPNALEFMPGSKQNGSNSPSDRSASPISEASNSGSPRTPKLLLSTTNGLEYNFPITVEDVTREPMTVKYASEMTLPIQPPSLLASDNRAIAYTLRQPRGPPAAEVKDLGDFNFAQRARRQLGGRLGGLRDLAQQRQGRY